jgi:hypothetical protein
MRFALHTIAMHSPSLRRKKTEDALTPFPRKREEAPTVQWIVAYIINYVAYAVDYVAYSPALNVFLAVTDIELILKI